MIDFDLMQSRARACTYECRVTTSRTKQCCVPLELIRRSQKSSQEIISLVVSSTFDFSSALKIGFESFVIFS